MFRTLPDEAVAGQLNDKSKNMTEMKKIMLLLSIAVLAACTCYDAEARQVPERRIVNIVNGFRGTDGFEIVKIGKVGLWALRSVAGMSDEASDPETMQALKMMKGIDRVVIVDYEEASERESDMFSRRISSALSSVDLLMSAADDDSSVDIYGTYDEKSGNVKNLVLFVQEDRALVCVFGRLSMNEVMKLANMN